MTTLRGTVKKLRHPRPFLGAVMAAVMIGFAAAPTPQTSSTAPTPVVVEYDHPLGAPAPLAAPSTSFAFLHTNTDGTPVRYDPCRAIHYVTRAANEPEGGPQIIKDSIAAVSAATGLVFIDDGATTEAPSPSGRPGFQPKRYGDRWAPVLIAWATTAEEPGFPDTEIAAYGTGGSQSWGLPDSEQVYVTGQVNLNAASLNRVMAKPHGAEIVRAVIGHELGHVVGLDHDNNEDQLMNWQTGWIIHDYQPGDLAGLAILGQGKCEPRL